MTHTIIISEDGTSSQLGNPLELQAEVVSSKRYSVIVPHNRLLCALFRITRLLAGDSGRMAGLSRKLPCLWEMRTLDGRHKATSRNRQELIELEHSKFNTDNQTNL